MVPDARNGHQTLSIEINGKGTDNLTNEAGGHRIQRVPRSERSGRVHSSTVTVAVLDGEQKQASIYDQRSDADFDIQWYSGTGCGGQYRNRHLNSARITHIPTGLVKSAQTRSRENSAKSALAALHTALDQQGSMTAGLAVNAIRQAHVGSGERSDRRRTYQFQNGIAVDHKTGRKAPVERVMSGHFNLLW